MRNPVAQLHDFVLPPPKKLWVRGGAEMEWQQLEDGREEQIPVFPITIESVESLGPPETLTDNLERVIGQRFSYRVETSDGIERETSVYIPVDVTQENPDFTVLLDTAWFTTLDGHNDNVAITIMTETSLPIIAIGAEHSAVSSSSFSPVALGQTVIQSTGISQAKSAQSSQLIAATLAELHKIPTSFIKIGESRGAMISPAQKAYAARYDNTIPYLDLTAPCVPKRLFDDEGDMLRLGKFPLSETMGAVAVGVETARRKVTNRLLGTVSLNAHFGISNIIGQVPALMSGEAGEFPKWMGRDTAIHIVTFGNDSVSRPEVWKEYYEEFPNVAIITLHGTHMTLAHPETLRHLIDRINRFKVESKVKNNVVSLMDWKKVHLKDDDRRISLKHLGELKHAN